MQRILEKQNKKHKAGFAVLFAVLLASFLISLGISIFNISLKEIQIVTSARDSQVAYYTADSAKECILYWDVKKGAFPACKDATCLKYIDADGKDQDIPQTMPISVNNITCNGVRKTLTFTLNAAKKSFDTLNSNQTSNFFTASSTQISAPVADINIDKTFNQTTNRIVTTITTYGHNTGILGRRVERGIQQINN